VNKMKPKDRVGLNKQHIGFVFQQYHLLDDLTVAENLDMPLSYRDVKEGERESLVADTLDRFGIVAKKDLYPRQLSGGQQQLVAVARALIHKPELILADEPTGNLHSEQPSCYARWRPQATHRRRSTGRPGGFEAPPQRRGLRRRDRDLAARRARRPRRPRLRRPPGRHELHARYHVRGRRIGPAVAG